MTENERTVIIGGSSGMGLALAATLLAEGGEVTIAGRSADRLAAAARELGGRAGTLRTHVADITREDDVAALFAATGEIDHVVVTAADMTGAYQPIAAFDTEVAAKVVAAKMIGPALVARYARLAERGSLTFTSGIAAYRPAPGGSLVAMVNAGLAGLTAALAVELGPVRVNAVSPGWVDTPIWDAFAGAEKAERHRAMAARLPGGRLGTPDDIARAFLAVVRNPFMTGTVLHVDGGHRLV
ncbi:SDR family oxidoreductase [Nocardia thailandica]|uniref:SDR family oxidoreductase n=1 Tax=Nocardia thailandica TaxID=257275 RepID=A0ABW6PPM1_9NOCA|nr:SDR family oxidoreductase [Nocardia thailandica]